MGNGYLGTALELSDQKITKKHKAGTNKYFYAYKMTYRKQNSTTQTTYIFFQCLKRIPTRSNQEPNEVDIRVVILGDKYFVRYSILWSSTKL